MISNEKTAIEETKNIEVDSSNHTNQDATLDIET